MLGVMLSQAGWGAQVPLHHQRLGGGWGSPQHWQKEPELCLSCAGAGWAQHPCRLQGWGPNASLTYILLRRRLQAAPHYSCNEHTQSLERGSRPREELRRDLPSPLPVADRCLSGLEESQPQPQPQPQGRRGGNEGCGIPALRFPSQQPRALGRAWRSGSAGTRRPGVRAGGDGGSGGTGQRPPSGSP